ncbi:MAG: hypothetical protein ACKOW5_16845, partial [Actinomycetales bacterium]
MTADQPVDRSARRRSIVRLALGITALLALNIAAYWALDTEPAQRMLAALSSAVYLGAFALAFFANVTVLVPIPYNAIVLQMAASAQMPCGVPPRSRLLWMLWETKDNSHWRERNWCLPDF